MIKELQKKLNTNMLTHPPPPPPPPRPSASPPLSDDDEPPPSFIDDENDLQIIDDDDEGGPPSSDDDFPPPDDNDFDPDEDDSDPPPPSDDGSGSGQILSGRPFTTSYQQPQSNRRMIPSKKNSHPMNDPDDDPPMSIDDEPSLPPESELSEPIDDPEDDHYPTVPNRTTKNIPPKSNFKLPVQPPIMKQNPIKAITPENAPKNFGLNPKHNLDLLSSGLAVKPPPQIAFTKSKVDDKLPSNNMKTIQQQNFTASKLPIVNQKPMQSVDVESMMSDPPISDVDEDPLDDPSVDGELSLPSRDSYAIGNEAQKIKSRNSLQLYDGRKIPPVTSTQDSNTRSSFMSSSSNAKAGHNLGIQKRNGNSIQLTTREKAQSMGYTAASGKFEGDPFESLYVKVDKKNLNLTVLLETGQEIQFDLSSYSYVFEDSTDPTIFVLDHRNSIIVFKFESADKCKTIIHQFPKLVFEVPGISDLEDILQQPNNSDNMTKKKASPTVTKQKVMNRSPMRANSIKSTNSSGGGSVGGTGASNRIIRAKGTSVEDLLEGEAPNLNALTLDADKLDQLLLTTPSYMMGLQHNLNYLHPQRRKELIDTYIRKPKYSIRRVNLLVSWINSMHIWPNLVTVETLHKEMCNGLLLARITKRINPNANFIHLNEHALAKKAALQNLEQALGHIWRSKSLNNSRIPKALEIYNGNTSKIAVLLNEIFGVYIQKPLYKNAVKMLKWYNNILKQYLCPLPPAIFEEGDLSGVWPAFQSGVALFCLIFHFYGLKVVGSSTNEDGQQMEPIKVDPLRIISDPTSICDFRDNVIYVFSLLEALNIDIVWLPEDWITHPDTEFFILQLNYIYEALKTKQCCLAPAQGEMAGITSGPNGEPVVVGMVFADTRPINSRLNLRRSKAVLLGYDKDSLPLLPVDRGGKNHRFQSSSNCPLGMVSNFAKLQMTHVELKDKKTVQEKNKLIWHNGTTEMTAKTPENQRQITELLRTQHVTKLSVELQPQQDTVYNAANLKSTSKGTHSPVAATSQSRDNQKTMPGLNKNSINSSNQSNGNDATAQYASKEIEKAMKVLENEMEISNNQLNSLEEDLANRYVDLETTAHSFSIGEYEESFNALESERKELEEEKARLQEHFTRRLATIKDSYVDAENRAKTNAKEKLLQSQIQKISSSTMTTSLLITGSPKSKSRPRSPQSKGISDRLSSRGGGKQSANEQKNLTQQEKGWIKLSTKMDTHNFHLKNRHQASSAALQNTWTPKHLKKKEQDRLALENQISDSHVSRNLSFDDLPNNIIHASEPTLLPNPLLADHDIPPEELMQSAFNKFKYRLQIASLKWTQIKHQVGRVRLQDLINNSIKPHTVELISLPEKSFRPVTSPGSTMTSFYENKSVLGFSPDIQREELQRMQYEDERRQIALSERALLRQYQLTQDVITSHMVTPFKAQTTGHNKKSYGSGHDMTVSFNPTMNESSIHQDGSRFDIDHHHGEVEGNANQYYDGKSRFISPLKPSKDEVEVSYRWLNVPRPLSIADRTPKTYMFCVVEIENYDYTKYDGQLFSIEWREAPIEAMQFNSMPRYDALNLMGYVAIDDIMEINESKQDLCLFTIFVRDSTRALKNSKGRTAISVRCTSPGECAKYVTAINCLIRNLTLRQMMMSLEQESKDERDDDSSSIEPFVSQFTARKHSYSLPSNGIKFEIKQSKRENIRTNADKSNNLHYDETRLMKVLSLKILKNPLINSQPNLEIQTDFEAKPIPKYINLKKLPSELKVDVAAISLQKLTQLRKYKFGSTLITKAAKRIPQAVLTRNTGTPVSFTRSNASSTSQSKGPSMPSPPRSHFSNHQRKDAAYNYVDKTININPHLAFKMEPPAIRTSTDSPSSYKYRTVPGERNNQGIFEVLQTQPIVPIYTPATFRRPKLQETPKFGLPADALMTDSYFSTITSTSLDKDNKPEPIDSERHTVPTNRPRASSRMGYDDMDDTTSIMDQSKDSFQPDRKETFLLHNVSKIIIEPTDEDQVVMIQEPDNASCSDNLNGSIPIAETAAESFPTTELTKPLETTMTKSDVKKAKKSLKHLSLTTSPDVHLIIKSSPGFVPPHLSNSVRRIPPSNHKTDPVKNYKKVCLECCKKASLWCQQCQAAFCIKCWGRKAHHSLSDMVPSPSSLRSFLAANSPSKYNSNSFHMISDPDIARSSSMARVNSMTKPSEGSSTVELKPSQIEQESTLQFSFPAPTFEFDMEPAKKPLPDYIIKEYIDYPTGPVYLNSRGGIGTMEEGDWKSKKDFRPYSTSKVYSAFGSRRGGNRSSGSSPWKERETLRGTSPPSSRLSPMRSPYLDPLPWSLLPKEPSPLHHHHPNQKPLNEGGNLFVASRQKLAVDINDSTVEIRPHTPVIPTGFSRSGTAPVVSNLTARDDKSSYRPGSSLPISTKPVVIMPEELIKGDILLQDPKIHEKQRDNIRSRQKIDDEQRETKQIQIVRNVGVHTLKK